MICTNTRHSPGTQRAPSVVVFCTQYRTLLRAYKLHRVCMREPNKQKRARERNTASVRRRTYHVGTDSETRSDLCLVCASMQH